MQFVTSEKNYISVYLLQVARERLCDSVLINNRHGKISRKPVVFKQKPHLGLAFDWLSVAFFQFDHRPIRMSDLLCLFVKKIPSFLHCYLKTAFLLANRNREISFRIY